MPTEFRDPRAAEIHHRLRQLGDGPPAFFADAYRLMEGDLRLETSSHLVGHALRELESSVRTVLTVAVASEARDQNDQIREITAALGGTAAESLSEAWIDLELHKIAHRDRLRAPRPVDERMRDVWTNWLNILSVLLDQFEATYGSVFRRMDALLSVEYPKKEHLHELTGRLPDTPATASYFYSRLTHPAWFDGLRSRGAFDRPPEPIEDEDEGTIRFPDWPQAAYLRRMASAHPDRVAEVLSEIETTNPRVQEQAISVALELPLTQRTAIGLRMTRWISSLKRFRWTGDQQLDFLLSLSDGPDNEEVLVDGIRRLIAPEEGEEFHGPRRGRVPWHLQKRGAEFFRGVGSQLGLRVIDLLTEALDARLRAQWKTDQLDRDGLLADHSVSWMPNLSDGAPHRRDSWPSFLVAHLRLLADDLVHLGHAPADVAARLGAPEWSVHARLELDFLARHAEAVPSQVRDRLLGNDAWWHGSLSTEMAALLREGFEHLDPNDQRKVLEVLWRGPDFSSEADPGLRETWRRSWALQRLSLVEDHLDDQGRARLEELREDGGEVRDPTRRSGATAMAVGLRSPKTADELAAMEVDELIEYLETWKPEPGPFAPDESGLAGALSEMIARRASTLGDDIAVFGDAPGRYASAVVGGLREALKEAGEVDWPAVLRLFERLVERTAPPAHQEQERPYWDRGIRTGILHVLAEALSHDEPPIPSRERESLWHLIDRMADDPDPVETENGEPWGVASVALNSVRPMAVRVAGSYARWLINATDPQAASLPDEVDQLLRRALDPAAPSPAVRSAVGKMLGLLAALDPAWVEENFELMFPDEDSAPGAAAAVFESHLMYGWLHGGFFPLLEPAYLQAIERSAGSDGEGERRDDPDEYLADHLMIMYGWGLLPLADPDGLVKSLFERATPAARRRAIHFVGWSLATGEDVFEADTLNRFRELWDWRASELLGPATTDPYSMGELVEFGWWFASRAFDPDWSLAHIRDVLAVAGRVEWAHEVAAHLGELFEEKPAAVLGVIRALDPTGGGEPWRLHEWKERLLEILVKGVAHAEPDVQDASVEIVNRWVAAGHTDMLRLLP